jgi:signal transduction histidine kinase
VKDPELLYLLSAFLLGIAATLFFIPPGRPRRAVSAIDDPARAETVHRPESRAGWGAMEVLERMSEGVVVLDEALRPEYANPSARDLLGLRPGPLPDRMPSVEVMEVARQTSAGGEIAEEQIEVFYPSRRNLRIEAAPLAAGKGVLLVIQDVTEEARTQRIRREFVAHASHELKSPVASLQALAGAIGEALPDDVDAARRFGARIEDETQRLSELVSDLLDLSKLEDLGRTPSDPCDLSELAEEQAEMISKEARERSIRFGSQVAPGIHVRGDAQHLCLLVRNLLENAVRYTPEEGEVEIQLLAEGSDAILSVRDTGIGIPSDAQARVFERFYRVDRGRSRDRGGTGLGLAIVKHVTELHSGSVRLESELGAGSTFTVTLPLFDDASSRRADEKEVERSA